MKLVAVLLRLRPEQLERLRELCAATRIPRATLLREAVDDLVAKYSRVPRA